MLDSNGNSIIQIQAVQSHVSRGREATQEQVYDWAREDSNLAMIFPLQPHPHPIYLHLSIYLFCAKDFFKKQSSFKQEKQIRKPFLLFKNHLYVSP